jgi:predicted metalloprotease with PDZ domain
MTRFARSIAVGALGGLVVTGHPAAAQVSAPISDLHYDVTVDSTTVTTRTISVTTTLTVTGSGSLLLSLPAWTPGDYEMLWFSRWVSGFTPTAADGRPLTWEKTDYETWRIEPAGAKSIHVAFTYLADTLDNAMSWTRPDFALFNGTNLFLYPVGRGFNYPATVTLHTSPSWRVATGMTPGGAPNTFTATNYHDLVDEPFFVGHMDVDSERVSDRWVRFATYPAGSVSGERRRKALDWIAKVIPPEAAVFHETPWQNYTVMQIADTSYGGASGLEHQNSHVDVVAALALDDAFMPALYAHEIFHSWNVKRMRPAEMVPYRYDAPQPTPWLWVSEGITDYYADLSLVRGGVVPDTGFYGLTSAKISEVAAAPPVALTDASVSTWVHPTDGTQYTYYPKGSLAGFMLDVMIRDASDNRRSLDDVMRDVYEATYKHGRGFTGSDWWGAVSRAAGGRSFADFARRYVDGREPYPWDSVRALAGLKVLSDSLREPRLGIQSGVDAGGIVVADVDPSGAAAAAGVKSGDHLMALGGIDVIDQSFGARFREKYRSSANPGGTPATIPVTIRRGTQTLTMQIPLRFVTRVQPRVTVDSAAPPKAQRVRSGILSGTTSP